MPSSWRSIWLTVYTSMSVTSTPVRESWRTDVISLPLNFPLFCPNMDHTVAKFGVAVLVSNLHSVFRSVGFEVRAQRLFGKMRTRVHLGGELLEVACSGHLHRDVDDAFVGG